MRRVEIVPHNDLVIKTDSILLQILMGVVIDIPSPGIVFRQSRGLIHEYP